MRSRSWFISLLVCVVVLLLVLSRLWLGHAVAGTIDLPITLQNWKAYEGAWIDQGESISNLGSGRGDKLISNLTMPSDLIYSGEVRFDSATHMQWGDAGLLIRATDISLGTDSLNAYYVGLRPVSRELLLGREEFDYVNLAVEPLREPLQLGAWYRLQLRAKGCQLEARAFNKEGEQIGKALVDDKDCRALSGAVGIRSYSMVSSWRHLVVHALR